MQTLHKKWSFPLRISSVNVTKSAGNLMENFSFCAVKPSILNGLSFFLHELNFIFLWPCCKVYYNSTNSDRSEKFFRSNSFSLISECFTVHYVLISSSRSELQDCTPWMQFEYSGNILQSFSCFETFWYFTKFSFHQEWNEVRLLVINNVNISCHTSCRTT